MSPAEIEARFLALPTPNQPQLDWLKAQGVQWQALAHDPGDDYGFVIASDRVVFDGRRFQFANGLPCARDAVPALLILAGDPIDVVAARPSAGLIASWLGQAPVLGLQHLWGPQITSEALTIHTDAIEWLRSERHGMVIIDPARAAWALADRPLRAVSDDHARRLRRDLKLPEPRIVLPSPSTSGVCS